MDKKTRIAEEVEKTLQCFEDFEKIEPNPFFLTRLKARIRSFEGEKERVSHSEWSIRGLRPALLCLLVVINIFSAILVFQGKDSQTETDTRSQSIAAFAEEYSLNQQDDDLYFLVN
jgi:hypothetical protein